MSDQPVSDRLITRVGKALFGDTWMGPMSRETGIRKGTIDDWDKARAEPARGVYERLLAMVEAHRAELLAQLARLEQVIVDLRARLGRP